MALPDTSSRTARIAFTLSHKINVQNGGFVRKQSTSKAVPILISTNSIRPNRFKFILFFRTLFTIPCLYAKTLSDNWIWHLLRVCDGCARESRSMTFKRKRSKQLQHPWAMIVCVCVCAIDHLHRYVGSFRFHWLCHVLRWDSPLLGDERQLSNGEFSFSEKTEFTSFVESLRRWWTLIAHMEVLVQSFALNRSISLAIIFVSLLFPHVPYASAFTPSRRPNRTQRGKSNVAHIFFKLDFTSIQCENLSTKKWNIL